LINRQRNPLTSTGKKHPKLTLRMQRGVKKYSEEVRRTSRIWMPPGSLRGSRAALCRVTVTSVIFAPAMIS